MGSIGTMNKKNDGRMLFLSLKSIRDGIGVHNYSEILFQIINCYGTYNSSLIKFEFHSIDIHVLCKKNGKERSEATENELYDNDSKLFILYN